jgi:hypothetical protein
MLVVRLVVRAALLAWPLAAAASAAAAAPRARGALGRARASSSPSPSTSCATLPGVWTGFVNGVPLYDEYDLQFEAGAAPGAFTAVMIRCTGCAGGALGEGWTLGEGQLSADNRTAVIAFDGGPTLHGNVSEDCSTILWDNNSAWQETSPTAPPPPS